MDQNNLKAGQLYWVRGVIDLEAGILGELEVARFAGHTYGNDATVISRPWEFIASDMIFAKDDYIAVAECNPPSSVVE